VPGEGDALKRPSLVLVVGGVVLLLAALAALIGFGAGHYTNRTKTVGTVAAAHAPLGRQTCRRS
jgi:hypothetical protein